MRLRQRTSPSLVAGTLIVAAFALVALAAPLIAPPPAGAETPYFLPRHGIGPEPEPPSAAHPLGLMSRKYDIFYGIVWGTRLAFLSGVLVTAGRLILGVAIGLVAGYAGRWVDGLLMRITDAFLSFPIIAAGMVMIVIFGREIELSWYGYVRLIPHREEQVMLVALTIFGWMSYARLVRGNMLSEREKEYALAARATGAGRFRIMLRHLWPNARQGLLVLAASDIGVVVITLALFVFVGLITPPYEGLEADWGQMLAVARDWIVGSPSNAFAYWYTYVPISTTILLFSVGWNLVGDGLRRLLDPRLR